jgi:hypothetical protein
MIDDPAFAGERTDDIHRGTNALVMLDATLEHNLVIADGGFDKYQCWILPRAVLD